MPIFVDEKGNIIDGDYILAIMGKYLKNNNRLNNNTIVGTVMSNLGFIKYCKENNINFIATKVGDRYVLEEMKIGNFTLGGEQSGHIILSNYSKTGDGQLTALNVFNVLAETNKKFSELSSIMQKYPQVLVNAKVSNNKKNEFYTNEIIQEEIRMIEKELDDNGRIVVRPSGTEPLIRVMVEGEDIKTIKDIANGLASLIEKALN